MQTIHYVHTCIFIFEFVDKKSNKYAATVSYILFAWHEEHIDILLEWDLGRIPKISNNLKTYKYFLSKFGQYMAKSRHMAYGGLFVGVFQNSVVFRFIIVDDNITIKHHCQSKLHRII